MDQNIFLIVLTFFDILLTFLTSSNLSRHDMLCLRHDMPCCSMAWQHDLILQYDIKIWYHDMISWSNIMMWYDDMISWYHDAASCYDNIFRYDNIMISWIGLSKFVRSQMLKSGPVRSGPVFGPRSVRVQGSAEHSYFVSVETIWFRLNTRWI